jgi:hypothetical protein
MSALLGLGAALWCAAPAAAQTQAITLTNHNFELPGPGDRPPDDKVFAYDVEGVEIVGAIPGWTFPGPGVEDFGHEYMEGPPVEGRKGDSGVEGDGNPGQEMILAMPDGIAYQTATGFTLQTIPSTQQYIFSFDAHQIFATDENDAGLEDATQLTVRFYYGAARTTLDTFVINPPPDPNPMELPGLTGLFSRFEYIIPHDSPLLAEPQLGEVIGIEFDVTSENLAEPPARSWAGIDNVIMEIAGVMPGDLDGDGDVDFFDYEIVRDNQRATGYLALADGDMNRDGIVNLNDFRAWKNLASLPPPGGGAAPSGGTGGGNVPEPSTLVLALFVAAVGGASLRRKSAKHMRVFVLAALCLGMVCVTASPSAAAVLAYDPFLLPNSDGDPITDPAEPALGEYNFYDYPEENPTPPPYPDDPPFVGLAGQNTTIGPTAFFSGPWTRPTPADQSGSIVQQPGLAYLGAGLGGSATTWPRPNPAFDETMEQTEANERYTGFSGRVGREFATPWNDSTPDATTYYMSFLANFGTTEFGMGYRTVEFWSEGVDLTNPNPDPFRVMEIGYSEYGNYNSAANPGSLQQNPATARMAIRTDFPDQDVRILETSPLSFNEDGLTHLIVLKFELNVAAESDTVTVWLDPTSITEPGIADALLTEKDIDIAAMSTISRFGGVDLRQANPAGDPNVEFVPFSNSAFDELRIGETFADVLPPLPYPGDTDGDGDADLDDLDTIMAFWGQTVGGGPNQGDVALANGRQGSDNIVGLADYALWKDWRNVFGSGGSEAPGLGVPEPSSLLLALLAAMALVGTHTRRIK